MPPHTSSQLINSQKQEPTVKKTQEKQTEMLKVV